MAYNLVRRVNMVMTVIEKKNYIAIGLENRSRCEYLIKTDDICIPSLISRPSIRADVLIIACNALDNVKVKDVFSITELTDMLSNISTLVLKQALVSILPAISRNVLRKLVTGIHFHCQHCRVVSNFIRFHFSLKEEAHEAMNKFYLGLNILTEDIKIDKIEREWDKILFKYKIALADMDLDE